jgi:hypothetical protein
MARHSSARSMCFKPCLRRWVDRDAVSGQLDGAAVEQRVAAAAVQLELQIEKQIACYTVTPRLCGTVLTIDSKLDWLIRNHLSLDEPDLLASRWKQFSRLIDRAENPELERLQFLSIVNGHVHEQNGRQNRRT